MSRIFTGKNCATPANHPKNSTIVSLAVPGRLENRARPGTMRLVRFSLLYGRTTLCAVIEHDLDLDGRVAAGVQDLPSVNEFDTCHYSCLS